MFTFSFIRSTLAGLALVSGLTMAGSVRAEMKENPEYVNWAKWKPGTTTIFTTDLDMGSVKIHVETSNKLVKVDADKIIVEQVATTTTMTGEPRSSPAKQREIPAKKEIATDPKNLGEEDVEVGGKKIHCKVYEGTQESPGGPGGKPAEIKAKVYVSDTVPGGMVKMIATLPKGTMTMTLKSFETK